MALNEGNGTEFWLPIVSTAAAAVVGLTLVQSDYMSRNYFLSDRQLQVKRVKEYLYEWSVAMQKAHMQQWYYTSQSTPDTYSPKSLLANTELIMKPEEIKQFIQQTLFDKTNKTTILRIAVDAETNEASLEFYVYLMVQKINGNNGSNSSSNNNSSESNSNKKIQFDLYQLPLQRFGLLLKEAFEDQVTSSTFCFVADASCGMASQIIERMVQTNKEKEIGLISEPLWMIDFARIIDDNIISSKDKLSHIMFGMCRLACLQFSKTKLQTIVITLPGQALTSTLLPLVQSTFPSDRHLFCYAGCVASVEYATQLQNIYNQHSRRSTIYTTLQQVTKLQTITKYTTPFSKTSLTKSVFGLKQALAKVPIQHAKIVETWMSSVNTFIQLKDNETKNGYLPYTCKISNIINPPNSSNHDYFKHGTDGYWSLSSLLQFITGCRSRPLPEGLLEASINICKNYENPGPNSASIPIEQQKFIENCVFCHKMILIENKTLPDTVLPAQHWTLKNALKKGGGCACCGPEDYDEEDEKEQEQQQPATTNAFGDIDMTKPGAFALAFNGTANSKFSLPTTNEDATTTTNATPAAATTTNGSNKRPKYVDGKLGFAFDPSNFS